MTEDSPFSTDIIFILQECDRAGRMSMADILKSRIEQGFLADLPHPSGSGRMTVSRDAVVRLGRLADQAGVQWGISRRVSHRELFSVAEDLFVRRFIAERRVPDRRQIDRFMAAVGRQAAKSCTDTTHFVPCSLMRSSKSEEFSLGPVIFRSRRAFGSTLIRKLKGHGDDIAEGWKRKNSRTLTAEALRFYRKFGWVAEVRIENCDPETSEKLAERAVTSALNCLQILFTAKHTDGMRVGGPAVPVDNRAKLRIDKLGSLLSSVSTSWAGEVGFPDDWIESLFADVETKELVRLFGIVLEAAVCPDLHRPVSHRFLDSAQWFGEACRDEQPATKVVKFVTALERMVMTNEKDDIAKLVSERTAAICAEPDGSNRQDLIRDTNAIYDLRSRLVHGSLSPSAPEIGRGVWQAAQLCECLLLNVLPAFGERSLTESISTKRIGEWFDEIVAIREQREAAI